VNYGQFLTRVIGEGIAAAERDYTRPDQEQKLRGSIAGFEACYGKTPAQLAELLSAARTACADAHVK
jgi:hypothetical protein